MVELALQKSKLDSGQKYYMEVVRDASQSLMALINDILDLSKIESGKLDLEEVEFDLDQLIQSSISVVRFAAQENGVAIHVEIDPDINMRFRGDILRIRQVLMNLLSNAVKFSNRKDVFLRIKQNSASETKAYVYFEVEDHGIGIDESTQKKLFTYFTQGDQTTTRKYGGTGLGLAICKELVTLMGGKIGVKSSLGQGSVFYFEISLTIIESLLPDAEIEKNNLLDSLDIKNRILVVEDNPINQKVIKAMLDELGYPCKIAADGEKALQILMQDEFDLVIMDGHMPVLDGYETTKRIREGAVGARNRRLPIIASTANAIKGDLEKCLECGMNDYISKPISLSALHVKLKKWSSHGASFLNKNTLNSLRKEIGGEFNQYLSKFVVIFRTQMPAELLRIRQLFLEKDFDALTEKVRSIKATFSTIGATTLEDLCVRLEVANRKDEEQVLLLIDVIEKNLKIVLKELEFINLE